MPPKKPRAPRTAQPEEVAEVPKEEEKEEQPTGGQGINDLMHLPLYLVWHELVKRGFHPGMVRKWDQPYCVFLLRECEAKMKGTTKASVGVCMGKGRQAKKPFYETQEDFDRALRAAKNWDEEYQKTQDLPAESEQ